MITWVINDSAETKYKYINYKISENLRLMNIRDGIITMVRNSSIRRHIEKIFNKIKMSYNVLRSIYILINMKCELTSELTERLLDLSSKNPYSIISELSWWCSTEAYYRTLCFHGTDVYNTLLYCLARILFQKSDKQYIQ